MLGNYRVASQLVAYRVVLSSMELVSLTGYGLGGPGFNSRWRQEIFLYFTQSRSTLESSGYPRLFPLDERAGGVGWRKRLGGDADYSPPI
jgi:hypothetical protein